MWHCHLGSVGMKRRTLIKGAISMAVASAATTGWLWRILHKPEHGVRQVSITKNGPVLSIIPLHPEDIEEGTHLAG